MALEILAAAIRSLVLLRLRVGGKVATQEATGRRADLVAAHPILDRAVAARRIKAMQVVQGLPAQLTPQAEAVARVLWVEMEMAQPLEALVVRVERLLSLVRP